MPKPQLFLKTMRDGASPEWREVSVRRVLQLMTLLLLAASWRLWIPQQLFPQIPLFTWAGKFPWACQWAIVGTSILSLLIGFGLSWKSNSQTQRASRCQLLLFAFSILLLFCIDQHRLQPWAYQAVLMFTVLACVQARRALTLLRLLTLSIYFYSAVSKLDYAFLHSMGQQFTETLLNLLGLSHWQWPEAIRLLVALAFPVGELLVAVLLAVPMTRMIGVYAALVMHGVLLLVLGPLGMNQQAGVLIWNVQFMLMAMLLFYGKSKHNETVEGEEAVAEKGEEETPDATGLASRKAFNPPVWLSLPVQGVMILTLLLPLLNTFGYWDHWLSWDLYSPGTSKTQIFLHTSDVEHLPTAWLKFAQENKGDPNWVQLRLDLWSLEELAVPIYPQARFQLGVAAAVSEKLPPDHDAWIIVSGPVDRFSGKRNQKTLKTRPQLQMALDQFWLNARPAEE